MISLRKAATELDRLESLQVSLAECFRLAIRATADYAIELDAGEATRFRERVRALAGAPKSAQSPAGVREMQSGFRAALLAYHARTQARADRLRKEVEAGAAAIEALTSDVAGEDQQGRIDREIERLREIGRGEREIERAAAEIADAAAKMRRASQVTIAQLRDEIRTLHERMDSCRRAAATDVVTGAWTREKIESRLHDLLAAPEPFWVVLVAVTNFDRLQGRYSPAVVQTALKALTEGLRELAGPEPALGRWSCAEFLVVVDLDSWSARALAREASARLSTSYILAGAPAALPVPLEIATGTVERAPGASSESFFNKLERLSAALRNP